MPPDPGLTPHVAHTVELPPLVLYQLLKLRVDVFVVEQRCAYPELDGRDVEPGARQLWLSRGDTVVACLRLLDEPGGGAEATARIGRVAVATAERGQGHAGRLVEAALRLAAGRPCVLDAQAHLTGLYARYGFVVVGPEYLEDGIWHVPMRRAADPVGASGGT